MKKVLSLLVYFFVLTFQLKAQNLQPIVTDFYPKSGVKGTNVNIYGSNLSSVNTVKFGEVNAEIIDLSENRIVVRVENNTVSHAPISVIKNGTTHTSIEVFTILSKSEGEVEFSIDELINIDRSEITYLKTFDLNSDGLLDIVYRQSGELYLQLNEGNAQFSERELILSNVYSSGIELKDIEHDGDIDIIEVIQSRDPYYYMEIRLHENNGNYEYLEPVILADSISNSDRKTLKITDYNNDGKYDLFVSTYSKIMVFEYVDKYQYKMKELFSTDQQILGLELADIDTDGDIDILCSEYGSKFWWFENIDGNFSSEHIIKENSYVYRFHASDLDNDGKLDLCFWDNNKKRISWMQNLGSGNFSNEIIINDGRSYAYLPGPSDINGDGYLDVLCSSYYPEELFLHFNNGSGFFDSEIYLRNSNNYLSVMTNGDFDNDGDLDIIGLEKPRSGYDKSLRFYRNDIKNDSFAITSFIPKNGIPGGTISIFGNGFNDHETNVILGETELESEYISENRIDVKLPEMQSGYFNIKLIDGSFEATSTDLFCLLEKKENERGFSKPIIIDSEISRNGGFCYMDVDNDFDIDIVITGYESDSVYWYENNGKGEFGKRTFITNEINGPSTISFGDLDMDHDNDLIIGSKLENKVYCFKNDGRGNFLEFVKLENYKVETPYSDGFLEIYAFDIDRDGDLDIITSNNEKNSQFIDYYKNSGQFEFSSEMEIGTGEYGEITIIDFNNNGALEVITNEIDVFEYTDNNLFNERTLASVYNINRMSSFVANNDGFADLVIGSSKNGTIDYLDNDGNEFFNITRIAEFENGISDIETEDIDNDGFVDVIFSSSEKNEISWIKNLGDDTFDQKLTIDNNANNIERFGAFDVDNDGDLDIVAKLKSPNKLVIYENQDTQTELLLIYPNGDERFYSGSNHIINWESSNIDSVDISYSIDSGNNWVEIIGSFPAKEGKYEWNVPQLSSQNVLIKIADKENNQVFDISDKQFNIITNKNILSNFLPTSGVPGKPVNLYGDWGEAILDEIKVLVGDNEAVIEKKDGNNIVISIPDVPFGNYKIKTVAGEDIASCSESFYVQNISESATEFNEFIDLPKYLDQYGAPYFSGGTVFLADIDNDSDNDIITSSSHASDIYWYENLGSNNFSEPIIIDDNTDNTIKFFLFDIDSDGDKDICTYFESSNLILFYQNNDNGKNWEKKIIDAEINMPTLMTHSDINNDGLIDLLLGIKYDKKIYWYKNLGGGLFDKKKIIYEYNSTPIDLVCSDVNGDGLKDIISILSNKEICWLKNNNGEDFSEKNTIDANHSGAKSIYSFDTDNDFDLDIIIHNDVDKKVFLYENTDANFGNKKIITTENEVFSLLTYNDLDSDALTDFITYERKIQLHKNLGNNELSNAVTIKPDIGFGGLYSAYASDMNNDGILDIIGTTTYYNQIWILFNSEVDKSITIDQPSTAQIVTGAKPFEIKWTAKNIDWLRLDY